MASPTCPDLLPQLQLSPLPSLLHTCHSVSSRDLASVGLAQARRRQEDYKKQERENHLAQKELALLPNICEASSRDSCRSLLRCHLIKGHPHHFSHRHALLFYPAFLKSLSDIIFVCLYIITQKADSLEKALMPGKIEGKRRRGWQRMRWLFRQCHRFNGHESEQTPGDHGRQRSLACCSPRGRKKLDMT